MKKFLVSLALVVSLFTFTGCDPKDPEGGKSVESIAFQATDFTLAKGTQAQLTLTAVFDDQTTGSYADPVSWSSSNETVATVTSTGLVSAVGYGTARIRAEDPAMGLTAEANITVNAGAVVSLEVKLEGSASVFTGQVRQLRALGAQVDGSTADVTTQVQWSVVEAGMGVISETGLLTVGSSLGTLTATATDAATGVSASIVLKVENQNFILLANVADYAASVPGHILMYKGSASTGELTLQVGQIDQVTSADFINSFTLSPNGRVAYLSFGSAASLNAYSIDSTAGTFGSPVVSATEIYSRIFAFSKDGRFAYASSGASGASKVYAVDAATGALSAPLATGVSYLSQATLDKSGNFLIGFGGSPTPALHSMRIDSATGALNAVDNSAVGTNSSVIDSCMDASGRFVYAVQSQLTVPDPFNPIPVVTYKAYVTPFDGSDGTLGVTQELTELGQVEGIECSPQDNLILTMNSGGAGISTWGADDNGRLTLKKTKASPVGSRAQSLTLDPTGRFFYYIGGAYPTFGLFGISIDPATGEMTDLNAGASFDTRHMLLGLSSAVRIQ